MDVACWAPAPALQGSMPGGRGSINGHRTEAENLSLVGLGPVSGRSSRLTNLARSLVKYLGT